MKEVYLIYEENHGVIGVAQTYVGVCDCLVTDGWLSSNEVAEFLKNKKNFEKFGIILEKKALW